ncbi:regulatory protein RecX [Pseudonocardia sp. GCM10023141]|uniref:regulatory protein RecX n=1 Tax=Pseudonocardia sp. GCM10023141 TaxID=3252653 RepID=UPI0036217F18
MVARGDGGGPESEPESGPAPVARYESIGSDAAEQAPVARFDAIVDDEAAPVAELGHIGTAAAEPAAPVAGLVGLGTSRPELPRVMRLSELTAPGPTRRGRGDPPHRSSAERPPPAPGTITAPLPPRKRRSRRTAESAPGPGFGPGPDEVLGDPEEAVPEEAVPAKDTGTGTGKRRRGWGEPVALAPGVDPVAAAKEICLRLLSDRARTRQELGQALRRKGIPDEAAATVLERFDEVGLIDDAAFAGQWVRSRHNYKGLARRAIAMELRRKGVDDEVAGEALAEVDADSEEKRAEELVARKIRSMNVSTPEQKASALRRLVGMLARKGYSGSTSYRVVKQALANHGVELDEFGEAEPGDD